MFAVLGFPAFCHLGRILVKPNIKSLISSSIEWARWICGPKSYVQNLVSTDPHTNPRLPISSKYLVSRSSVFALKAFSGSFFGGPNTDPHVRYDGKTRAKVDTKFGLQNCHERHFRGNSTTFLPKGSRGHPHHNTTNGGGSHI